MNTSSSEGIHLELQVVANEIEFMSAVLVGGVDGGLRRRQGEDQPAMPCVHGFQTQDVAKKGTVSLGIFTVNDNVRA